MSYESDETYTIYESRTVKARKAHVCDACKLPINAGDHYQRVFTVDPGNGADHVKRCGACQTTYLHLTKLCQQSGELMGVDERLACGLRYDDEWGGDPPDEIAALPFLGDAERGQLLAKKAKP